MLLRRANKPPSKTVVDPSGLSTCVAPLMSTSCRIWPKPILPRKSIVTTRNRHTGLQPQLATVKAIVGIEAILELDPVAAETWNRVRHAELLVDVDLVFEA